MQESGSLPKHLVILTLFRSLDILRQFLVKLCVLRTKCILAQDEHIAKRFYIANETKKEHRVTYKFNWTSQIGVGALAWFSISTMFVEAD